MFENIHSCSEGDCYDAIWRQYVHFVDSRPNKPFEASISNNQNEKQRTYQSWDPDHLFSDPEGRKKNMKAFARDD